MSLFTLTLLAGISLAACQSGKSKASLAKSLEQVADTNTARLPAARDTMPSPASSSELLAWMPTDARARVAVLTGRIEPSKDSNFVVFPAALTDGDGTYLLRRQTATALTQLIAAAAKDGIKFRVISATRNFDRQAQIWGAKWRGERTLSNGVNLGTTSLPDTAKARMILLYSSMPGTSRHHWGSDLDLNDLDPAYWKHGQGAREYAWLQANAAKFGFFQPYSSKLQGRSGYEEEHWHWSYAPLSVPLLQLYLAEVKYADIQGFDGSLVAARVRAIEDYVQGIDQVAAHAALRQ